MLAQCGSLHFLLNDASDQKGEESWYRSQTVLTFSASACSAGSKYRLIFIDP